jgi:hypothetical protein
MLVCRFRNVIGSTEEERELRRSPQLLELMKNASANVKWRLCKVEQLFARGKSVCPAAAASARNSGLNSRGH